jgi:ElaA protein
MLVWRCKPFEALTLDELYDSLALRQRVFVLEQGPYLDCDGADRQSHHLMGFDDQGAMHAYLRIVEPGVKFSEVSIGRVVTSPERRSTGQGHALVAKGLLQAAALYPRQAVRISAQAHLDKFYRQHGFEACGEVYLEDNIPHLQMLWSGA